MIDRMKKFQEDSVNLESSLNASGRFSFQKKAMKRVIRDIADKLQLLPTDTLLDIGCNCGDISIPLSFMCEHVTCIDGEGAISRLRKRTCDLENIDTIVGNFLTLPPPPEAKFDCILAYSVLMYIDGYEAKRDFTKKACMLLKSGGRLLIGDVVNSSVKTRFSESAVGKEIEKSYKEQMKHLTDEDIIKCQNEYEEPCKILNDCELFELMKEIRSWGKYESFLLPQPKELAFGFTRQDLLIKAW